MEYYVIIISKESRYIRRKQFAKYIEYFTRIMESNYNCSYAVKHVVHHHAMAVQSDSDEICFLRIEFNSSNVSNSSFWSGVFLTLAANVERS